MIPHPYPLSPPVISPRLQKNTGGKELVRVCDSVFTVVHIVVCYRSREMRGGDFRLVQSSSLSL